MGTDIHVVAQVRGPTGTWEDLSTKGFDIYNRNYAWFYFLCGIRGHGRVQGMTPIAEPRGAPEGFQEDLPHTENTYYKGEWMGYGIYSWVTLAEILGHERTLPNPLDPAFPLWKRVGPIDELERLFAGHPPADCRIVFGFDS